MRFVMEESINGDTPNRVLQSANDAWLKMAAQRLTAQSGGRKSYTVRPAYSDEDLSRVNTVGRTVILVSSKTE